MIVSEFVAYLYDLDVKLWHEGDELRINAPKEVLTPDLRADIARRKAEILVFLQTTETFKQASNLPIQSVARNRELPLSFAQHRLWFLDQLEPGSTTYNIPIAVRLTGVLNVSALEHSLNEIVRRHEALRTSFIEKDGQPFQVIVPTLKLGLPVVDLGELPDAGREAEGQRLASEEAQRPFDLGQGPLLRTNLLRLSEAEHMLLLTMHHIVSDGWSVGVFMHELGILYKVFSTGQTSPLPELPIQYADFAYWQRQWLHGEVLEEMLFYWKQQLGDAPPVLELPTDRPRPAIQTFQGAKQSVVLTRTLSEKLKNLSRQEGVTLFMTLLAAFQILLHRYTGQNDIIVGSPIAGRNRTEFEGLIGFFINTLVLCTDLSGNPPFREILQRVREVALGAYDHQDLPFEKLVQELKPERDLSRTPLFQVMFNTLNIEDSRIELHGLSTELLPQPESESKFDLTLYVREQNEGIRLDCVYYTDLFHKERMIAMLAQYRYLLEQIVADSDTPILFYSLAPPEIFTLLPDPRMPLPEPKYEPITNAFISWAKRTPEHPAVSQGSRILSYKELAQSAQSLAKVLLFQGVQPGESVAVCGPRSFGLIACMLGVFLGRAVLLTIDQNLSVHRQQIMIKEAMVKYLLYAGIQRPEDNWMWESLDVINVDPDTAKTMNLPKRESFEKIDLPDLAGGDAAFIFFTSGTTGVPKGVLGCHKGLSHFLNWQRQAFAIGSHDRSAQLTGLSFDVVLRDVFLPLVTGATLCLPPANYDLKPAQILPWLEREKISLLHTVPSLAQTWLVNVPPGVSLRALRWVFFAGEPLKDTLIRQWRQAFPEAGEIVNLYGPTETTLAKCCYEVPDDILPGVQPVGSPMPETQALILSNSNQLCGIGESGEIVIRTPFRSLGYINAREENEKRFIKNPFNKDPQDLLYRTGDRGRYRLDGSVEILGRLDYQVKIRGVRIEPEEVEVALGQHPDVHQTVVIAREDVPDEKSLVAYVVAAREQTPTVSELSRFLKQRLPEPMRPSAFVMLDALPLNPNGKVNRQALPAPDGTRPELDEAFVMPRTPVEEILAGIWSDLLGVEQVGIYDNFFDLGGHSLMATRVVSRICESFQVELPLSSLFEAPTVADQTERLEAVLWATQDQQADSSVTGDNREEIEL